MRLTTDQLHEYEDNGLLFLPSYFPQSDVDLMLAQLPNIFSEDSPARVLEKNGQKVRAVHGSHLHNEVFRLLSRHPKIVVPAMQLLDSPVYTYQFKINAKVGFDGDVWEWHQDFVFWLKEDGMQSPRATSVVIFLDEVNEFNGPLFLSPGSHKKGLLGLPEEASQNLKEKDSSSWISNVSADLKYSLDHHLVKEVVNENGLIAPKGPKGSILFFHPNLVHGSAPNISPFNRTLVIITYNSVENVPIGVENPRPEFLVGRDHNPVEPLWELAGKGLGHD